MPELLQKIIDETNKNPTIVNDKSNFVVVTYWWGKGNLNQNTARPCIAFYEDIFKKTIRYFTNMINTIGMNYTNKSAIPILIDKIFKSYQEDKKTLVYIQMISKIAQSYMNSIYEYCDIDVRIPIKERDEKCLAILEKYKSVGKTPQDFEFKNKEYVENILFLIVKYAILINKTEIIQLYLLNNEIKELEEKFIVIKSNSEYNDKSRMDAYEEFKKEIQERKNKKNAVNNQIKVNLRVKKIHDENTGFSDPKYNNTNIFDILNLEFRYLNPIKFEEMIQQWEIACKNMNCNFLSVEYPEFAQPGGYQMAINAKPLFIKKSLELCKDGERGVLYIDGDMYIRKYPMIFDLRDVDFMARGWWIDPRSSWKMNESITYDPYTFETSGGTMFFSQSQESKMLIEKWVNESDKPYNKGKADDRILSLIFNTNKFLCNMKIIQLPIEYLWLTLDYDERMLENVYDYDVTAMKETIIIEHPECLTSEDTAAGAGASSDRTPKFYSFLEDLDPVSEEFHEYIFFPDKEMVLSFKSYLDYMQDVYYINDGNKILIDKKFVDESNNHNNAQPIYVIDYDKQYGTKRYMSDPDVTVNQVVEINMRRAEGMNTEGLNLIEFNNDSNMIEIQNVSDKNDTRYINDAKMIALIIKLLRQGKHVIYNPVNNEGYNSRYYDLLKSKIEVYKFLDFVFVPDMSDYTHYNSFYRPKIQTNMPMFFSPGNEILLKFLSMFLSLNDLSDYINYGSYEFISRVRIGYLFLKKNNKSPIEVISTGGSMEDSEVEKFINNYEEGLQDMYENRMSGGVKKSHKRMHKKTYKKQTFRKRLSQKNQSFRKRLRQTG
jgi:hypothetical protein